MSDFRKVTVWQKAHRLTLDVYRATAAFPQSELYGLTSQMRRCCVSIGSNIAEGCGRSSEIDKARFLGIAKGSASELEYQVHVSCDLGYLPPETGQRIMQQVQEVGRMLSSLTGKVRAATA
jgi:four helix bundle protein